MSHEEIKHQTLKHLSCAHILSSYYDIYSQSPPPHINNVGLGLLPFEVAV